MANCLSKCSWVVSAGAAVHVGVVVKTGAEGVAVVLAISAPSIVLIVETLPSLGSISIEAELISRVSLDDIVGLILKQVEVVADFARNLGTVEQEDELRFDTGVEVLLEIWCSITINFNMSPFASGSEVLVITLNLSAHRVPGGREIDESISGSELVKTLDNIID